MNIEGQFWVLIEPSIPEGAKARIWMKIPSYTRNTMMGVTCEDYKSHEDDFLGT